MDTVVLYRPVGPEELELIRQSNFSSFPRRLSHQPFFYPVLSEEYAIQIARDWNAPASGVGYVTQFQVRRDWLENYEVHIVGSGIHKEYWIPAGDLNEFNENIVGSTEVIREFRESNAG